MRGKYFVVHIVILLSMAFIITSCSSKPSKDLIINDWNLKTSGEICRDAVKFTKIDIEGISVEGKQATVKLKVTGIGIKGGLCYGNYQPGKETTQDITMYYQKYDTGWKVGSANAW